jgi:hypothetical protein
LLGVRVIREVDFSRVLCVVDILGPGSHRGGSLGNEHSTRMISHGPGGNPRGGFLGLQETHNVDSPPPLRGFRVAPPVESSFTVLHVGGCPARPRPDEGGGGVLVIVSQVTGVAGSLRGGYPPVLRVCYVAENLLASILRGR